MSVDRRAGENENKNLRADRLGVKRLRITLGPYRAREKATPSISQRSMRWFPIEGGAGAGNDGERRAGTGILLFTATIDFAAVASLVDGFPPRKYARTRTYRVTSQQ